VKGPGGIDHHFGLRLELFAAFDVARDHAVDEAFGIFRQPVTRA
jgi:hypothetical protein